MGWLVLNGALPAGETRDSFLRKAIEGPTVQVLASAFVGSTWYAAVRLVGPTGPFVTAAVFLTQGSERRGFGYKDMSETMGPVECRCPANILAMLSPVEDLGAGELGAQWAAEWRERCRRHNDGREIKR